MKRPSLLLLALGVFALPQVSGASDIAAASFAVNKYRNQCGGSNLTYPVKNAQMFLSELVRHGYNHVRANTDSNVEDHDLIDRAFGGLDDVEPTGSDWADVVYLDGHGSHTCQSGKQTSRYYVGKKSANCAVSTRNHMRFGNGPYGEDDDHDTNIGISFSCNSAQLCVWKGGGYSDMSRGKFMIWNGFHGLSYDSKDNYNRLRSYVRGAKYDGIGDDWVDEMTDLKFWWWEPYEQCATSVTWGANKSELRTHYKKGGFRDWHNVGRGWTGIFYICKCDPTNGERLPKC